MGTKYEPLEIHLRNFKEIEQIIGSPLPRSAYEYEAWWANQTDVSNRPQAKAWISAGFMVESVSQSPSKGSVRFRRR